MGLFFERPGSWLGDLEALGASGGIVVTSLRDGQEDAAAGGACYRGCVEAHVGMADPVSLHHAPDYRACESVDRLRLLTRL